MVESSKTLATAVKTLPSYSRLTVECTILEMVEIEPYTILSAGLQVDVVYTDFKAAFDRVNHEILLYKLERMGVSIRVVRWLKSYLADRSVRVRIGSTYSETFSI